MRLWLGLASIVCACGLVGCDSFRLAPSGALTVRSVDLPDAPVVSGTFDTAVYAADDHQTLSVLLVDGPADAPRRVVHVRMFWRSRAGKTPFDPSATNSVVRYIDFRDGGVMVYGGGGLLRPKSTPGKASFSAVLANATLRRLDASAADGDAPADSLGDLALAEGSFTARLDADQAAALLHRVQLLVKEKLGYPRLVRRSAEQIDTHPG